MRMLHAIEWLLMLLLALGLFLIILLHPARAGQVSFPSACGAPSLLPPPVTR